MTMFIHIVDCKQSYFLRTRTAVFERKVWSGCRNGMDSWGKGLARFTREDYDYGASHLPNREEKATLVSSAVKLFMACIKLAKSGNSLGVSPRKFLFTHSWLRLWTTATLFSLACLSIRQNVLRMCSHFVILISSSLASCGFSRSFKVISFSLQIS